MQYIIDGHNLIPKVRGLSLSDPEDEKKLIDLLISFLRMTKSRATVFFDRAAEGHAGERNFGLVKAIFVPEGRTADSAIIAHIYQMGGAARNQMLVSSDRSIQVAARSRHVPVMNSEEFANDMMERLAQYPSMNETIESLTQADIAEWEALFNQYGSTPDGYSP